METAPYLVDPVGAANAFRAAPSPPTRATPRRSSSDHRSSRPQRRVHAPRARPARVAHSWSWRATLWPLGLYAALVAGAVRSPRHPAPRQPDRRLGPDRLEPVHVVLRVVAARAPARAQPVRHPRDVRPRRLQPHVGHGHARAKPAACPDHAGVRAGRHLERHPACVAGAERLDGVPAVPPRDAPHGALAGRRLHLRVLAVHADPPDRRAVPGAGAAAAAVRAAGAAAAGGLDRLAGVRAVDGAGDDRPVLDLQRGAGHGDAVRGDRAGARVRAAARAADGAASTWSSC